MSIKYIFKTGCHCVAQIPLELQGSPITSEVLGLYIWVTIPVKIKPWIAFRKFYQILLQIFV